MHDQLTLQILKLIPRCDDNGARGITSKQLHAALQKEGILRDRRTIQRKLLQMKTVFGFESDHAEDGKPQHTLRYWRGPKSRMHEMGSLSLQEALLLVLAEKQLKSMLPASLHGLMQNLFVQANDRLKRDVGATDAQEWLTKVHVTNPTQPLIPAENRDGVFMAVTEALYSNQFLDLTYKNKMGETRSGHVMPLGLAQQGNKTLLVCRCDAWDQQLDNGPVSAKTHQNWNLMMHRIQHAKVMKEKFLRPSDFSLQKHEESGGFAVPRYRQIRLEFETLSDLARSLAETKLSLDQHIDVLKNPDGQTSGWHRICATVADTQILDRWLQGFGSEVRNIQKTTIRPS